MQALGQKNLDNYLSIFIYILIMKVKSSLKNAKKRQGCKLVKRGKTIFVINKLNKKFKAKQG